MKTVHVAWVLLFSAAVIPTRASNAKVDSLKRLLQTHTAIDRAEVLWNIAYELFDVDNPQAVFYAERAYEEVWAKGDSLQIVKVGTTYGQLLRRVGKLDKSIGISATMLPIARRNDIKKYLKMLLNSLGVSYTYREKYDLALGCYYESLELRKVEGDTAEMIVALQNLSFIFYRLGDHKESINYAEAVLGLAVNSNEQRAVAYGNIGSCHLDCRRYELARKYLLKAIKLDSTLVLRNLTGQFYQVYAQTLYELSALDSADYFATMAMRISKERVDIWPLTASYSILARIAIDRHDFRLSERYIQLMDSILSTYPSAVLQTRLLMVKIYNELRSQPEVAKLFRDFDSLTDSLLQSQTDAKIRHLHNTFAQKDNLMKIQAQDSIMALQLEALNRNRVTVIVITFLLLVVAALAFSLYQALLKMKQINSLLDERVAERTRELGLERDSLQHYVDENSLVRLKLSSQLISKINTLCGLLHLVSLDPQDTTNHTKKAEAITAELRQIAQKVRGEK